MISVAKENYAHGTAAPFARDRKAPELAAQRLEPQTESYGSCAVSEGHSHGFDFHLSEKQLAEIEKAKIEAGVR